MSRIIKITMMMAFVIMGVRAKTVTECRETDCKSHCQIFNKVSCTGCVFGCASPPSFQYSNTSNQNPQSLYPISLYIYSDLMAFKTIFERYIQLPCELRTDQHGKIKVQIKTTLCSLCDLDSLYSQMMVKIFDVYRSQ